MKKYCIFAIVLVLMLTGCKSAEKIVYQHDTIYKTNIEYINKIQYDSIYIKDSISREVKNDTLYIEKYKNNYVYKYIHDTIKSVDTLVVNKEIEVEKQIKKNTPLKNICTGGFIILILIILMRYLIKKY